MELRCDEGEAALLEIKPNFTVRPNKIAFAYPEILGRYDMCVSSVCALRCNKLGDAALPEYICKGLLSLYLSSYFLGTLILFVDCCICVTCAISELLLDLT